MRILDDGGFAPKTDQRSRNRVKLSWTVHFFCNGGDPLEGRTHNVSCEGFLCAVPQGLRTGESIHCTIVIPTFNSECHGTSIALNCRAKVVRMECLETGAYNVACHIEAYDVIRQDVRATAIQ